MKSYNGYLIDLDGTMYRGEDKIEAASRFVKKLQSKGIPYLFVTNNSSRTPEAVADKLLSMDIPSTENHVFTTSMATAQYIYDQYGSTKVYMIGEKGLEQPLLNKGLTLTSEDAGVVVMGIDRDINYEKLAKACLAVRDGAAFLSTNGDAAIPTERGLLPGNGSYTSVVSVSTGIQPLFIGKPEAIIIDQALAALGTSRQETLMVGDNYETDIMAGINADMDTLIVHTGVTTKKHLAEVSIQPTYSVNSLDEWNVT